MVRMKDIAIKLLELQQNVALKRLRSIRAISQQIEDGDALRFRVQSGRNHQKGTALHAGDTIRCFLLFLERHPVRPCSCSLL
jgi:hypothetical protein